MSDTMTTKEAAGILGVHPVTLRKWRQNSAEVFGVMEDCHGLMWWLENPRKTVYDGVSVRRLSELLNRRKQK